MEFATGVCTAVTVMSIVAFAFAYLYRLWSNLRKQQLAALHENALKAIETTGTMQYPACFVRASDFVAMGRLYPHEEMRNRGLLLYRDSSDELANSQEYTIFLSHQV